MNAPQNNDSFSFSYSSKEREEVKSIREKYTQKIKSEETSLERLRRLDSSVTNKATAVSLIIGIIGALIMGTGMSLVMTELGELIGEYYFAVGITTGLLGLIMVSLAYPLYNAVTKLERKRIAPEILRISDELME